MNKTKEKYQHRMKPWNVPKHIHQWDTQPFGRKKCLICGRIQRRDNTTMNRNVRRAKELGRLVRRYKTTSNQNLL